MKLGVLICDPVSKKLRHISGDYREMFSVLFKSFENHVKLKFYNVFSGDYPTEIDECDAYISSGAAASVYDDEQWVRVFEDYIRLLYKERVRFVGICFGHQMIAQALGGKVGLSENDWGIGVKTSHFKKRPLWLKPAVNNYHVLVSHRDQILELPQDSVLLAGNKHCPNAMFQTGQHFLGIQGHPEFTVEYALALMNSRSEDIGDDILIRARESLSTAADAKLLAKWIMSFLEKNKAEPRGSAFRGI